MHDKAVDLAYAKTFLERLNTIVASNEELKRSFEYDGYSWWQCYQQLIFEDIKEFSKHGYSGSVSSTVVVRIRSMLLGLWLVFVSLLGSLWFIASRQKVVIYSVDSDTTKYHSDFRIISIYDVLKEESISYTEIFHTISRYAMVPRYFKRARLATYLESTNVLFFLFKPFFAKVEIPPSLFDVQIFETKNEHAFACFLFKRYLAMTRVSRFRVRIYNLLFRCSNARVLFSIDDTRYYHEVLLAAKQSRISTYALQHGHFTKYHVGWLHSGVSVKNVTPDVLLLWSEYWKKELLRLGTYFKPEQLVVAGLSSRSAPVTSVASPVKMLLFPYETIAPKAEVIPYLRAVLACKDARVIFKLRPDIPADTQLLAYGLEGERSENLIITTDITAYLSQITAVVGVYSTLLYELLALGKCPVLLKTTWDYGEGMIVHGLAEQLDFSSGPICSQLEAIQSLSAAELYRRNVLVAGSDPQDMRVMLKDVILKHVSV